MNIVIIGAGALGSYFGGRLQQAGQDVQYLVRKNRAKQLKENGISITSPHGNYQFNDLHITEKVSDIEKVDLVILAVKGQHLQGTLTDLKVLVEKGAKVLPLLNGLEHVSILQDELGDEAVLGGSAFIIATLDEKGHVIHSNDNHDLIYGPLHPSQKKICDEFEQAAGSAIMKVSRTENILIRMWIKYMFITAFSGVTTASNLPIGTIRRFPETNGLLEKVLVEMKELANAYDVGITVENIAQALENMAGLPEESTSSMHQDRRKGLTLEVEHLQGGALRLADKVGLKLPVIGTLYALIKPFEN
ncbi:MULTISPECIES: ketopantoate reductase family protein [Bacillaceae]|uniref:2-dehydropantoate 2-reductase n=1 Tax=Peribacillus simplex NBRC 15720 = DSM 1321 TaxID=1349754 RepID=A0A223EG11_9BACI|nr:MULTISPECIES: 2-dehydropantoate 2-reductase [Bacillaceae]ASS94171.1 2-dehydropantoate 2-reductase [Peribacillus simplex NBRC 15720 = DSM 1321]MEC1397001.1 2-dehydropantoate 2-reductase [Peribacillus simplex]MED3908530.1 2-dehydropantoate 2-reductase [Peribacillus simplex]MED3983783.1 2-dehydropantoate 2-reductase [Peribacillus simplex]MED4095651.1 2-dehydropantoate 2-reductase [Peribacillus simplex]